VAIFFQKKKKKSVKYTLSKKTPKFSLKSPFFYTLVQASDQDTKGLSTFIAGL
jgi:hypothetical protein